MTASLGCHEESLLLNLSSSLDSLFFCSIFTRTHNWYIEREEKNRLNNYFINLHLTMEKSESATCTLKFSHYFPASHTIRIWCDVTSRRSKVFSGRGESWVWEDSPSQWVMKSREEEGEWEAKTRTSVNWRKWNYLRLIMLRFFHTIGSSHSLRCWLELHYFLWTSFFFSHVAQSSSSSLDLYKQLRSHSQRWLGRKTLDRVCRKKELKERELLDFSLEFISSLRDGNSFFFFFSSDVSCYHIVRSSVHCLPPQFRAD